MKSSVFKLWHAMKSGYWTIMWNGRDCGASEMNYHQPQKRPVFIQGDVVYMVELERSPLLWALYCCCSVAQSCPTLCDVIDCSMPGFPVLQHLPELTQTHVHWLSDDFQLSHPLSPPFPPALNLSQHKCLFQWVISLHQVAKVLELQPQQQSLQWIFKFDFL